MRINTLIRKTAIPTSIPILKIHIPINTQILEILMKISIKIGTDIALR